MFRSRENRAVISSPAKLLDSLGREKRQEQTPVHKERGADQKRSMMKTRGASGICHIHVDVFVVFSKDLINAGCILVDHTVEKLLRW